MEPLFSTQFTDWINQRNLVVGSYAHCPAQERDSWIENWEDRFEELTEHPTTKNILKENAHWILGMISSDEWFMFLAQSIPPQHFISPSSSTFRENPLDAIISFDNANVLSMVQQCFSLGRHWSGVHTSTKLLSRTFESQAINCLSFFLKNQKNLGVFNTLSLKESLPYLMVQGNQNAPLLAELLRARYDELRKIPSDWASNLTRMDWWKPQAVFPFEKLVEQIDTVFSPPSIYQSSDLFSKMSFFMRRPEIWSNNSVSQTCLKIFTHPDFSRDKFFNLLHQEFPFSGYSLSPYSPQYQIISCWPEEELKEILTSSNNNWPEYLLPYSSHPSLLKIELSQKTSHKGKSGKVKLL